MPRRGQRHTAAARERIRRGTIYGQRKRAALARIAPAELLELEYSGTVARSIRPFAAQAIAEAAGFVQALGGEDRVSEQRMALVQDAARLGLLTRALVAHIGQRGELDAEEISKVVSLVNARRASLMAIGLDRVEHDALDLRHYLEQHRAGNPAGATNGADRDVPVAQPINVGQEGEA